MRRVIFTADDFGLSEAVNEAVERAHRAGVLGSASLMVAAPAAADAVRGAKAMPGLHVGLHLVVIEGDAVLPAAALAGLVEADGRFGSDQFGLSLAYCRHWRRLAAEIRAQFTGFAATGMALDHADAHKHMHVHPVVGRLLVGIGREFGLRAVRVPAEPPAVMRRCGEPPELGDRALYWWSGLLRRQALRAGMVANDAVFGLRWTGGMTEERLLRLIPELPEGVSEIYCHPAASADAHEAEMAALLSPKLAAALAREDIRICAYGDL